MEINTWSRQVVLTNAFTGRLCSSLSLIHCFCSALIYSLSSYKVCLISKGVIPLLLHLWCIMQSDWTQSLKELSAIILGVCVCVCVRKHVHLTEGTLFLQYHYFYSANIWNCATCYGAPTDGWEKNPMHFIKYYIFSSGTLFCLWLIWCSRATPAGITAD